MFFKFGLISSFKETPTTRIVKVCVCLPVLHTELQDLRFAIRTELLVQHVEPEEAFGLVVASKAEFNIVVFNEITKLDWLGWNFQILLLVGFHLDQRYFKRCDLDVNVKEAALDWLAVGAAIFVAIH